MHLSIGCQLDLRCEPATPLLALVHVHSSLAPDLDGPERLQVLPDRSYEVLTDQAGNRWCRLLAASGSTSLTYAATIQVPDGTDPVHPHVRQCPIQALPIDAYRFLNASTLRYRGVDGAGLEHLLRDPTGLAAGAGHL